MLNSRIDWCDSTWNPVTGCLHGCEYCYARKIAERFSGNLRELDKLYDAEAGTHFAEESIHDMGTWATINNRRSAYPYGFEPTFHRYRLNNYIRKSGRNIFVCSMADLFGDWVPLEWQREVFAVCRKANQHNYLFLTKNPGRYLDLESAGIMPHEDNFWFGTSITNPSMPLAWFNDTMKFHWFLSIEPLLEDMGEMKMDVLPEWVIIGAETGNRKGKVMPEKLWVDNIVRQCKENNIPVFMKESLTEMYGDSLIREFPPGLIHG